MKFAVAVLALAALLFVQLPASAGMVDTPDPVRQPSLQVPGVDHDTLHAGSFLETYQLIVLGITVVVVVCLLIAIIGYGIFESEKKEQYP